jgi:hypothetical protein
LYVHTNAGFSYDVLYEETVRGKLCREKKVTENRIRFLRNESTENDSNSSENAVKSSSKNDLSNGTKNREEMGDGGGGGDEEQSDVEVDVEEEEEEEEEDEGSDGEVREG